ncbi:acyltransferase, partial [Moorena sp. SIO3I6]|uniref:acyltransferase n=1 Tax=Moorena sp. SIO3I6 TaxID=2607831 RepID=UPI0025E1554D
SSLQLRCQLRGDVIIGNSVLLAQNVFISSGTHQYDYVPSLKIREQDKKYCEDHGKFYSNPIEIGDDCWLGINVVITPGTNIGRGCVIGANAVVTKNIAPYSVAGGVPAKVLKKRLP